MLIMAANVFEAPCPTKGWKGACLLFAHREHAGVATQDGAAAGSKPGRTEHDAVGAVATLDPSAGGERPVASAAALHGPRRTSAAGRGRLRGAALHVARASTPPVWRPLAGLPHFSGTSVGSILFGGARRTSRSGRLGQSSRVTRGESIVRARQRTFRPRALVRSHGHGFSSRHRARDCGKGPALS